MIALSTDASPLRRDLEPLRPIIEAHRAALAEAHWLLSETEPLDVNWRQQSYCPISRLDTIESEALAGGLQHFLSLEV